MNFRSPRHALVLSMATGLLLLAGCQASPPTPPPSPPGDTTAPAPVEDPAEVDSAPAGSEASTLGEFTSLGTEGV
ncbi:MAG: hypothetical protein ACO35C_05315, partial [Pontimonas sp.]